MANGRGFPHTIGSEIMTALLTKVMPEIPQSEIAATNFFSGRETGRKIGRNFRRNFDGVFVLCTVCRITQKNCPQFPCNLSLRVLQMKCQNFISVSFWGWRVSTIVAPRCRTEIVSTDTVRARGIVKISRFTRGICKNQWYY